MVSGWMEHATDELALLTQTDEGQEGLSAFLDDEDPLRVNS